MDGGLGKEKMKDLSKTFEFNPENMQGSIRLN
jgi:hypothetical protein